MSNDYVSLSTSLAIFQNEMSAIIKGYKALNKGYKLPEEYIPSVFSAVKSTVTVGGVECEEITDFSISEGEIVDAEFIAPLFNEGDKVMIKYDASLLPEGYTESQYNKMGYVGEFNNGWGDGSFISFPIEGYGDIKNILILYPNNMLELF